MRLLPTFAALAGLLSACASIPDISYSYYPVQAKGTISVVQTIDCTKDRSDLVIAYTPTVTTTYSANKAVQPRTLVVNDLDGLLADTDVGFTWYDDGRLKTINATTTGQTEAVAKAAISLATAAIALGGGAPAVGKSNNNPECALIAKWGGGKPVSLTYAKTLDYSTVAPNVLADLAPVPASARIYAEMKPGLPLLQVLVNTPVANQSGARFTHPSGGTGSGSTVLKLQEINEAQVDVLAQGAAIYSGLVSIPSTQTYDLPIPRAALFGKQGFSLTLSEAGAITAVDYGKTTGAAGALNVATAATTAATPESAAARAAELKGQADQIAQQQRLLRCQTNPASCQ